VQYILSVIDPLIVVISLGIIQTQTQILVHAKSLWDLVNENQVNQG